MDLTTYLKNIRNFEMKHIKSEKSTIGMIWGLCIITGGIIDGYIGILSGFSPHAPVWFSLIITAMISQQIISSQPLLYEKEFLDQIERDGIKRIEVIFITIIMLLTIPIGSLNVALVMPYIAFAFGITNIIGARLRKATLLSIKSLSSLSFLVAALVIVIGLIVQYQIFLKIAGFVFGLIVGSATFYSSYLQRRVVST